MWNGTERLHEGERVRRKMREKSGKKSQNKVTLYKQHCWDITMYTKIGYLSQGYIQSMA